MRKLLNSLPILLAFLWLDTSMAQVQIQPVPDSILSQKAFYNLTGQGKGGFYRIESDTVVIDIYEHFVEDDTINLSVTDVYQQNIFVDTIVINENNSGKLYLDVGAINFVAGMKYTLVFNSRIEDKYLLIQYEND